MLKKTVIVLCGLLALTGGTNVGYSQTASTVKRISKSEKTISARKTITAAKTSAAKTIMNIKGYPTVFELNIGDQYRLVRAVGDSVIRRNIKLMKITPYFSPNYWNLDEEGKGIKEFYSAAEIQVEIDGERVTLLRRPYEHPVTVKGLRIYVEEIKEWGQGADLDNLMEMEKDVRISVCGAGESWGPESFNYPVEGYSFRSSSYNNTWGALVPYAPLYYHRGEDRGAIPDRLPVHSILSGKITGTPVPDGDGASNGVIIQNKEGIVVRIAHMNTENIVSELSPGRHINSGDLLGYTGSTWLGGKNQTHDPHVHVEMRYVSGDTTYKLSAYPYLTEAYMRKYKDPVLAIAGGYEFTVPGKTVQLDGSRSVCRGGESPKTYKWVLHTGDTIQHIRAELNYDKPGLYTEELIVETASGKIDRDFLQVRVWDTTKVGAAARNIAFGWIYQYPVRNVKAGDPVMFWNRIHHTVGPVYIDFGDGTKPLKIYDAVAHPYRKAGRYVATISGVGPAGDPITEKLEVVVE